MTSIVTHQLPGLGRGTVTGSPVIGTTTSRRQIAFMSNNRRVARLAAVGTVGALALAACSSGSSGGGTPSGSGGASGYNAAVSNIVNPSSKTGGTLRLGATGDCDSWDPANTYYAWCWDMERLYTRSLLGFAPKPGKAGTEIVPDLAASMPTSNADKTEWTVKLQSGLKWDDGTPITTKDIKYGIERLYATDIFSTGPGVSYYVCLLDKCDANSTPTYKGPYKDKTGDLASIQTPDDTTIIFKLQKPFADFQDLLALPTSAPVPKARDTGAKYTLAPAASGPFKMTTNKPGQSVTWTRNTNWSQATDKIRSPKVDSVTLTILGSNEDMDARLLKGDLDAPADGGILPPTRKTVLTDPKKKANADDPVTGFTRYLAVYQTVAPLTNKACREAIFYAVNKSELRQIRGGDTGGDIAHTMTPPLIPGYDANFNPYPSGPGDTGDIAKAKSKLQECGQPNGFPINIAYPNTGVGPKLYASLQQSLSKVGIKASGLPGDQKTYYSGYINVPANVLSKKIGLAVAGWGADFPTAYGFWASIANGAAINPNGTSNYVSENNPTVNQAIADLTKTTDPAQIATLAKTVDQTVMNDAVYLPFQFDKTFYYRNPRLTNIYLNGGVGNYYDYVNIGVSDGK